MKNSMKKIISAVLAAATIMAVSVQAFAESTETQTQPTTEGVAYTGGEVTPPVTVSDEGVQLQNGVDYDLTYENNVNIGTATVIITFKGNYSGEKRVSFNIVARALTSNDVAFSIIENQTFENGSVEPKPTITVGDITLVEGKDYDLVYENNTDVGTATVTAVFKDNYSGEAKTTFEIISKSFTQEDVESGMIAVATTDNQTYTGNAITPEPAITYGDITLVKDRDYTLSYENNINAGTATINVTFTGNYSGAVASFFEIVAKSVSEGEGGSAQSGIVISNIPDQIYTGAAITPEPIVTDISR